VIVNVEETLIGIVTSYDTTEYFRRRAEDMMFVEDIESTLKDFIRAAFTITDEADQQALATVITEVTDSDLRKKFQGALSHYLNRLNKGNSAIDQSLVEEVFTKHFASKETAKSLH